MLHVLLETSSPRARYIIRHVFERMIGWPVVFSASPDEFARMTGAKLVYGAAPVDGAFHVRASGWLEKKGIDPIPPPTRGTGTAFELFPIDGTFDVFAASFFLLSLMEEYTITARDAHERVPPQELLIVRGNAVDRPIVDHWALRLAEDVRSRFPALPAPSRTYRHVLTVDVDNGPKYAARSWHRALGASAREIATGRTGSLIQRWRVRSGKDQDPYLSFVDRLGEVRAKVDRTIAFILTRGEGRFDHAARLEHPVFNSLLENVARVAEIGLHPSYESSRNEALIAREHDQLTARTKQRPRISRQHFLRWKLPATFRVLIARGFTEEHSIGFSDRIGFRAGTCTPFPWYDVEREEETPLVLYPFAVMDSALADRTGAGLQQAVHGIKRMSDAVREVRGTFISVWHDRYLSGDAEFKGGPEAMRELVEHAKP